MEAISGSPISNSSPRSERNKMPRIQHIRESITLPAISVDETGNETKMEYTIDKDRILSGRFKNESQGVADLHIDGGIIIPCVHMNAFRYRPF
jgi:hypothetical protein